MCIRCKILTLRVEQHADKDLPLISEKKHKEFSLNLDILLKLFWILQILLSLLGHSITESVLVPARFDSWIRYE